MKRIGYLYDKMLDKEFIKKIILQASKRKTKRKEVIRVLNNIDLYTDKIYKMLVTKDIQLRPTHQRTIKEN